MNGWQKSINTLLVTVGLFAAVAWPALADVEIYPVTFDAALVSKGYTIASPDNNFRLGIFPDVLSAPTAVVLKRRPTVDYPLPEGMSAISDYWEFDIADKTAYDGQRPIVVQMVFPSVDHYVGVYFWNGTAWQALPSKVVKDGEQYLVRAFFHLPYARFLVLGNNDIMTAGMASWYRYKDCDCAASPDYPKGSMLRVTRLDSGVFVDVTVNDFGPDRLVHPERVIDLDKVAFKKLGMTSEGVMLVNVSLISTPLL